MAAYAAVYARALVDVVVGRKLVPSEINQQLTDFGGALESSPALREVLYNPSFKLEKRLAVVDSLVARMKLVPEVRNFIAVVMRNGRLHAFNEMLGQYRSEMNKREGISEASITSARKLDEQERRDLEAHAATIAGNRVHAIFVEDPALVGGVILKIGSTVYDGSVRGRMQRLKEQLIAG